MISIIDDKLCKCDDNRKKLDLSLFCCHKRQKIDFHSCPNWKWFFYVLCSCYCNLSLFYNSYMIWAVKTMAISEAWKICWRNFNVNWLNIRQICLSKTLVLQVLFSLALTTTWSNRRQSHWFRVSHEIDWTILKIYWAVLLRDTFTVDYYQSNDISHLSWNSAWMRSTRSA